MANTKITELTALTQCAATDVLPIVKVSANTTKKVSISDLLRNAPAGTAGAPSIANAGDQDTGILFPADNSVGVSTGGTQRLVIDSSGRLLLGTTTEGNGNADNLTIADSANSGLTIRSGSSNIGSIFFSDATSGTGEYAGFVDYNHSSNLMSLGTASSTRMSIDSSGNVGVGTSSPQAELHLNDATGLSRIRLSGGASAADNFEFGQGTTGVTNGGFEIRDVDASATRFVIDSSGRLGVGTSSPGRTLDVNGVIRASGTSAALAFGGNSSTPAEGVAIHRPVSDTMAFITNNSERLRIDSSGQVIIGGTTPLDSTKQLTLTTTATSGGLGILSPENGRGDIFFGDAADDNVGQIRYSHVDNSFTVRTNTLDRFKIDSSGRVGIGTTSPSQSLTLRGEQFIETNSTAADSGNGIYWQSTTSGWTTSNAHAAIYGKRVNGSNGYLRFDTRSGGTTAERLRVDSSGNCGIGTSSPDQKLHIVGNYKGVDSSGQGVQIVNTATPYIQALGTSNINDLMVSSKTFRVETGTSYATSERLRIDSSGRVGIGTTSPLSGANLTVAGSGLAITGQNQAHSANSIRIGEEGSGAAQIRCYGPDTSTNGSLTFRTSRSDGSNSKEVIIDSSGNVGIGTTSPGDYLASAHQLVISDSASTGLTIATPTSSSGTIAFADGTGAADNARGLIRYGHSDNSLQLSTNAAERMRIDSSGRLGIGTSSPATSLHVEANVNNDAARVNNTDATNGYGFSIRGGGTAAGRYCLRVANETNAVVLQANANKNVLFNCTSVPSASVQGFLITGTSSGNTSSSGSSTTAYNHFLFYNGNGIVGSISTSGSATTYSTSSDYRLKENVVDLDGAITRVKQLQPKRFNFIVDADTTVDGFLAHEAQIVVPEAVTGAHNAVKVWQEGEELPDGVSVGDNKLDEDGNTIPDYQGIDQAKLVPLLTAALQEAIAKIETLEAKVAALEAQ